MKAVVAAFNQEKALVGAFSVIVKTDCETDGALHSTSSVAMRSTCHITVGLQRRSAGHRQILSMDETLSIIRIKDDVITIILVTVKCGRRF